MEWISIPAAAVIAAVGCGDPRQTSTAAAERTAEAAAVTTSDAWLDPAYHASPTVLLTVSLAPVPSTGALAERADQGFERVLLDAPGLQMRLTPGMVRERMNGNRELVGIVNRIQMTRYAPDAIGAASLKALLSGRELQDLRTAIGDPLAFIAPVDFAVERRGAKAHGTVLYRVYHMETGRILRQARFTTESAAPAADGAAEQKVLVALILAVEQDFSQYIVAH
jgi:hypothetical protein